MSNFFFIKKEDLPLPHNLALNNTKTALEKFTSEVDTSNRESIKRARNYLEWTKLKTDMIQHENEIHIPKSALPKKVTSFTRDKLNPIEKQLFDEHYSRDGLDDFYKLDRTKIINDETIHKLMHILSLNRGNVVWVEFGFNICKEFGGKHPALILRKVPNALFVTPLSSSAPESIKDWHVKVDRVYNYAKQETRWINIHRIINVSLKRVDFNSPVGSVKGTVLTDISDKIKKFGLR